MATTIYNSAIIHLFDGTELEIIPLKIKYLREFMDAFEHVKNTKGDDEAIEKLVECVRICMKQYYPRISRSIEDIEDSVDMRTIYTILDIAVQAVEAVVAGLEVHIIIYKIHDNVYVQLNHCVLLMIPT